MIPGGWLTWRHGRRRRLRHALGKEWRHKTLQCRNLKTPATVRNCRCLVIPLSSRLEQCRSLRSSGLRSAGAGGRRPARACRAAGAGRSCGCGSGGSGRARRSACFGRLGSRTSGSCWSVSQLLNSLPDTRTPPSARGVATSPRPRRSVRGCRIEHGASACSQRGVVADGGDGQRSACSDRVSPGNPHQHTCLGVLYELT